MLSARVRLTGTRSAKKRHHHHNNNNNNNSNYYSLSFILKINLKERSSRWRDVFQWYAFKTRFGNNRFSFFFIFSFYYLKRPMYSPRVVRRLSNFCTLHETQQELEVRVAWKTRNSRDRLVNVIREMKCIEEFRVCVYARVCVCEYVCMRGAKW